MWGGEGAVRRDAGACAHLCPPRPRMSVHQAPFTLGSALVWLSTPSGVPGAQRRGWLELGAEMGLGGGAGQYKQRRVGERPGMAGGTAGEQAHLALRADG